MNRICVSACLLLILLAKRNIYAQWQILAQFPAGTTIGDIYFLDDENTPLIGFACGSSIWRTSDRGTTWTKMLPTLYGNGGIGDITFKDGQTGWFITCNPPKNISSVYQTTDAGLTWTMLVNGNNLHYSAIHYNKTFGRLFLSDLIGNSMVSTDDGATWNSFAPTGHNGFSFFNDNIGICSSYNSSFLFTFDGGATWNKSLESREVWQPLAAQGSALCFALSERTGDLLQSKDSGDTWNGIPNLGLLGNSGQIGGAISTLYYQSTNPLCDSMVITSLAFQDSLGLIFDLPQTPYDLDFFESLNHSENPFPYFTC